MQNRPGTVARAVVLCRYLISSRALSWDYYPCHELRKILRQIRIPHPLIAYPALSANSGGKGHSWPLPPYSFPTPLNLHICAPPGGTTCPPQSTLTMVMDCTWAEVGEPELLN